MAYCHPQIPTSGIPAPSPRTSTRAPDPIQYGAVRGPASATGAPTPARRGRSPRPPWRWSCATGARPRIVLAGAVAPSFRLGLPFHVLPGLPRGWRLGPLVLRQCRSPHPQEHPQQEQCRERRTKRCQPMHGCRHVLMAVAQGTRRPGVPGSPPAAPGDRSPRGRASPRRAELAMPPSSSRTRRARPATLTRRPVRAASPSRQVLAEPRPLAQFMPGMRRSGSTTPAQRRNTAAPGTVNTNRTTSACREIPCLAKICFRCQRIVPSLRPVAAAISRRV